MLYTKMTLEQANKLIEFVNQNPWAKGRLSHQYQRAWQVVRAEFDRSIKEAYNKPNPFAGVDFARPVPSTATEVLADQSLLEKMQRAHDKMAADNVCLQLNLGYRRDQVANLKAENEALNREVDELRLKVAGKCEAWITEFKGLIAKNNELKSQLRSKDRPNIERLEQCHKKNHALHNENIGLKHQNAHLVKDLEAARGAARPLAEKTLELEAKIEDLRSSLNAAQAGHVRALDKIEKLLAENATLRGAIYDHKKETLARSSPEIDDRLWSQIQ